MNTLLTDFQNYITGLPVIKIIFLSVILAAVLVLSILLGLTRAPKRINIPLGIIGIIMAGFTCSLATVFIGSDILYIHTNGNPEEVINNFYALVLDEKYEESYLLLKDYTTLGFENEVHGDYTDQIYKALQDSYSYEITSPVTVGEFTATAHVRFTYLEVQDLSKDVSDRIEPILETKVNSLSRSELYDEDGNYLTSLLDAVYSEAFDECMEFSDKYIVTDEYDVTLEYVGDTWLIDPNDEMLYCFSGGTR